MSSSLFLLTFFVLAVDDSEVLEGVKATLREIVLKAQAQLRAIEGFERQGLFTKNSDELESRLKTGPWKQAASKKSDYWRDAPDDLVNAVRSVKGGIKGDEFHYTASLTEPTLFRFKRDEKK
jgi:hypothetical protein